MSEMEEAEEAEEKDVSVVGELWHVLSLLLLVAVVLVGGWRDRWHELAAQSLESTSSFRFDVTF